MKIAIIGAGFTGLTAAYKLTRVGHNVTVFEKENTPGGLAVGYKEKEWDWSLEAFYHHWFTNDKSILDLAKELNYPVIIKRPKTSSLIEGKIYQLDSALTLLKFSRLSARERLQMGLVLAMLRYNPFWKPLEKITAAKFLSKTIGENAYKLIWEPLLRGKFGKYTNEIALSWFWARIVKRTTFLAYPEGGFLKFAQRLEKAVLQQKGKIFYNTSIEKIEEKNEMIDLEKFGTFDKLIITLPSFAFIKMAPKLPEDYKKNLMNLRGIGAVILILRLKKPFFDDGTYWLNVCEPNAPILAVVEHTNLMDKSHYNNEHLVYLGNYLPSDHKYFSMDSGELLKEFDPFLKKINPNYANSIVGVRKFSIPFAQPIIPTNYSKMIPSFKTPMQNVYLANMQQVYPWDRGTNYAVELGEKIAKLIFNS